MKTSIVCPLDGNQTTVVEHIIESGIEHPVVLMVDTMEVTGTARDMDRVTGWLLEDGCMIQEPDWHLLLLAPNLPPHFVRQARL